METIIINKSSLKLTQTFVKVKWHLGQMTKFISIFNNNSNFTKHLYFLKKYQIVSRYPISLKTLKKTQQHLSNN